MWRFLLLLTLAVIASPAAGQAVPGTRDSLLVTPEWLDAHLGDSNLVVLQVERDRASYLDGHIPGARLVLLSAITVTRDGLPGELPPLAQLDSVLEAAGVSNGSRIVLYGDPLAAGRLFFTLDYLGLAGRVALLDGGLSAWTSGARPLSRAIPESGGGCFEPRVQPELLVNAAWISRRLGDTSVTLLDARVPGEYSGQVAGDGVTRAGHIPGAGTAY